MRRRNASTGIASHTRPANLLLVIALCVGSGCKSNSLGVLSAHQPGIIAIRNTSGAQAKSIRIQDDRDAGDADRRIGALAPVLENFTYTFVRPADAPPLPEKVRVIFSYRDGRQRTAVVDLREALRQSTGEKNEAIVFELRPGNAVV